MNRKSQMRTTTKKKDAEAQVEELLKAVEDDMLLNLSLNSHMSRVSPDYINSDLDRRFRTLKSRPSSSSSPKPPPTPTPTTSSTADRAPDAELKAVLGDDLCARFAKLRASLSPSPSASSKASMEGFDPAEEDQDDEVEKLIRWAKDAARLDPSPPSDDDEDQRSLP